ncbi:BrnT family toxin [Rhizobium sp.]
MSDKFDWDREKASANFDKHGVSFDDARDVFRDVFAIDMEDTRFHYDEPRFVSIGMSGSRLLVVVYTTRQDMIRIISARAADPREQRWYYDGNR